VAAFPWGSALRAAVALGLSPREFWRLAPRELAMLLDAHRPSRVAAPSHAAMADLMRRFPDGG